MKFRKKPVVIEAIRYTLDNREEAIAFCQGNCIHKVATEDGVAVESRDIKLPTLEGTMRAEPGDWIIRGIKGELYPCKNDIFEATYEPVEE